MITLNCKEQYSTVFTKITTASDLHSYITEGNVLVHYNLGYTYEKIVQAQYTITTPINLFQNIYRNITEYDSYSIYHCIALSLDVLLYSRSYTVLPNWHPYQIYSRISVDRCWKSMKYSLTYVLNHSLSDNDSPNSTNYMLKQQVESTRDGH